MKLMVTWRGAARAGMWAALVVVLAAAGLLAISWLRPGSVGSGGLVVGLKGGQIEAAWGGSVLRRHRFGWEVRTEVGVSAILMSDGVWWRPRAETVPAGILDAKGRAVRLTRVTAPVWLIGAAGAAAAGGLCWRTRRVTLPGHCRGCGYDLRGLSGSRCPECGREGLAARAVRAALRLTGGGNGRVGAGVATC